MTTALETIMANPPVIPDFILLDWMRTEFNLPESVRVKATTSFLRVWNGCYVMQLIEEGKLEYNGCSWIVHFQTLPSVVRVAVAAGCSFRLYKGIPYVVIKLWKGEGA